ncbi:MAG: VWA domain-containing protein [Deltaproteobacteria bacterium]|nr:VWA domain-containing protein [Candidatus Zymogenaceae bacterium]
MKLKYAIITLCICLCAAGTAFADGIIIIDPPPHPSRPVVPLEVKSHLVHTTITDQVSVTHVDEVFYNPNDMELEGTFLFPIPEGASITDFVLYIDGKPVSGEVLPASDARKIYEDIVRTMKDPALLEYAHRNLFTLKVYPIPANGTRRIELTYTETLAADFGMISYNYPLNTEKYSSAPIDDVSVDVTISSSSPIRSVYCPSHDADIIRKNNGDVIVSYEDTRVLPDKDFLVYYSTGGDSLDASLLTYKERREDGYFLLIVTPETEAEHTQHLPKDVTFVLDTSGSMKGDKLIQAKNALEFCIDSLNAEDRFNVIRFSTDIQRFTPSLVSADRENRSDALDFVDEMVARGGTNIHDALINAIDDGEDTHRPHMIVFITDGEPTVGETDNEKIIKSVTGANDGASRIFVFGVGEDINTHLLDKISQKNHGASDYVTPTEDIEVVVSNFFTRVSSPVLSDVTIDVTGVSISDIYPQTMPDLFAGMQLIVAGRYSGGGGATIILKGRMEEKDEVFEFPVTFEGEDDAYNFIPRIWATRKIAYLLDEIRLNGEQSELVEEVTELAKEYGIVTPYTSFLVTEDKRQGFEHFAPGADESEMDMMTAPGMLTEERGGFALKSAEKMKSLKETNTVADSGLMSIKQVGDRTFFFRDDIWIDSRYDEGAGTTDLKFDSDRYWDFLSDHPDAGKYLALGESVIFEYDGSWYRVR